jgi:hypothetical protein
LVADPLQELVGFPWPRQTGWPAKVDDRRTIQDLVSLIGWGRQALGGLPNQDTAIGSRQGIA